MCVMFTVVNVVITESCIYIGHYEADAFLSLNSEGLLEY